MTNEFLLVFILVPLAGFFISFWLPEKRESLLSWTAFGTVVTQLVTLCAFIIYWISDGAHNLNLMELSVWNS